MMALHTSNVEPLAHQITAVYGSMLPRQPLRDVVSDDPGAGKTVMAGLLIRELLMRGPTTRWWLRGRASRPQRLSLARSVSKSSLIFDGGL